MESCKPDNSAKPAFIGGDIGKRKAAYDGGAANKKPVATRSRLTFTEKGEILDLVEKETTYIEI